MIRQELCRWHGVADEAELQQTAIETILGRAARAIHERGRFHLVLAGGKTPRPIYRCLSVAQTDWTAWHIYFGDERCLPPRHPARNSNLAADVWLHEVPIPPSQVHIVPAEQGAREAARRYAATLKDLGDFDLVLLGLGEDGHTASLFPGHQWGIDPGAPDVLPVFDAPKPPPERVSMSAGRLGRTRMALFLVSGEAKHGAVAAWRSGQPIPARSIRPEAGVDVLVEAGLLEPLHP